MSPYSDLYAVHDVTFVGTTGPRGAGAIKPADTVAVPEVCDVVKAPSDT